MSTTASPRTVVCPVCLRSGPLGPGPGGRPGAACQGCGSLERHRALAAILPGLQDTLGHGCTLDVAPSRYLTGRLREMCRLAGQVYVGMDFDPGADKRQVTVQASLTQAPLPDDSVGLMICFHVLEHIPDDIAAMREMARVLAPGGIAVVQVPWRPDRPTDEDPSAPVEERLRRFGQADHVRWYGSDLEDRMKAAGLEVVRLRMGDLFDPWTARLLGVVAEEPLWLCSSDARIDATRLAETSTDAAHEAVVASLERGAEHSTAALAQRDEARARVRQLRGRLRTAKTDRDEAVAREQALRQRLDVRVTSGIARRVRRLKPQPR